MKSNEFFSWVRRRALYIGAGVVGTALVINSFPAITSRKFRNSAELSLKYEHAPPTRSANIERLDGSIQKPFDVLIIGGGATGAGCALDATLRGLDVAIIEKNDFASGTSSRSTKLIHGGVRYLEKAVFGLDLAQLILVYEALRERSIMINQAPHLCSIIPTMLPCYRWWEVPFYYAGLKTYDVVAALSKGTLKNSFAMFSAEAKSEFPTLRPKGPDESDLCGAIIYYDGQQDDARMNLSVALSAAIRGATVCNYMKVVDILRNDDSQACGVKVCDEISGEVHSVYAKSIINATGPLTDDIRKLEDSKAEDIAVPSAGVHIALPGHFTSRSNALIIPKTKDGRVVFMVPWLGHTIAGTTDRIVERTGEPRPTEEDVEFILESVRDYLALDVKRTDVLSVWAGIRPLAKDPNAKNSASILREHSISMGPEGIVTITGGKWTTYRKMAEDTVNFLLSHYQGLARKASKCSTETTQLVGAHGFSPLLKSEIAQSHRDLITSETAKHLARNYGTRATAVLRLVSENAELAERIVPEAPVIAAEVQYCAESEYAERAIDFLTRRTRMAFLNIEQARRSVPKVVELMARVKDWSAERQEQETKEAFRYLQQFTAQ
ncbi:glycerol-3-phosphate dehydrogenase [Perkinsela sp. CCAP 1560/4]|nr:glycerol-3-phosphate dehydrogenase [Perkinsela sp. CCAP 1560/4]|eukprot:KNH03694.1 glycerol-3-phosphate dehydrogenase [Perkinsela sp. CCAP 1560/4]